MVDQREVRRLLGLHARADVLQARGERRSHSVSKEIVATVCIESESRAVQEAVFLLILSGNVESEGLISFPPKNTQSGPKLQSGFSLQLDVETLTL